MTFILGFGAMVLVSPATITSVDKGGTWPPRSSPKRSAGRPSSASSPPWPSRRSSRSSQGLTLSGAAALSHDLWVSVARKGEASPQEQLRVARIATVALGILAVLLGIVFKGQNVAYMVSLAFAIAASANFPALLLSIFWRGCTTMGVVSSMIVGTSRPYS